MKVLALILSGCKSESSPEQNFPLLRTLKLQLNFQQAKQKQQKKDQMFLIYEQKWIRQWSTVSCCLTPWITLSGRRNASRVFPRPASNPPLPPSLNASRAAKTCSNPQIFNGGSRSFHRYQPCPAESWGREPEFTVLFFDSQTCRGQKLKSCCRNAPRSVGETDVKQNSLNRRGIFPNPFANLFGQRD